MSCNLGSLISKAMSDNKVSHNELAEKLRVSQTTLRAYIKGNLRPRTEKINSIAYKLHEMLGVSQKSIVEAYYEDLNSMVVDFKKCSVDQRECVAKVCLDAHELTPKQIEAIYNILMGI